MGNTVNQNVIVPEVYAELVREKVAGKVMVAQACKVLGDLKGKVGETLTQTCKYLNVFHYKKAVFFQLSTVF